MKVLIGVDPHKTSVAVAAVDEAKGELLERASFPQDRAGLRSLERWASRFPERRWAMENARGLGKHLAGRLAATGESVVDVPPKLSARVRVLSTGNARKNDRLDAIATALAAPRATSGWQRWIQKPHPRCCACFPRDARTWWPSVHEPSTACTGSCGTYSPAGWPGNSRPTGQRASCVAYGPVGAPRTASVGAWPPRYCAT